MRKRQRREGQAIVETCLVIITLLLMIVGIMDFGQFLFLQQALTDRARAGARYAATNVYDTTAIKNMVVYNSATAPSGSPPPAGLFGLQTSYVTVTPSPSAAAPAQIRTAIETCFNCAAGGSYFPINLLSPFLTKTTSQYHGEIVAVRQAEGLGATN